MFFVLFWLLFYTTLCPLFIENCDRVQNFIKLQHEGNQQYFTVDLPEAHTPEMLRDGIEAKSNDNQNNQIGDRASWFLKMLTSTPLSFWNQPFRNQPLAMSIEDLVKAANNSKSDCLLLQGWIAAAQKTGNLVWLQALAEFSQEEQVNRIVGQPLADSLILDFQQQAAEIHLLKNPDLAFSNLFKSLLFRHKTIWNEEVSAIVLDLIISTLERFINTSQLTSHYWGVSEFIRDAAKYIASSQIPSAKDKALDVSQRLQDLSLESENK
jgi:hypothetical protein